MGRWMPAPSEHKGTPRPGKHGERPRDGQDKGSGNCASLTLEQQEQQQRRMRERQHIIERHERAAMVINRELRELEKTKLPFGVHKGKTFDETPLLYLVLLLAKGLVLFPDLKRKLALYLGFPVIAHEVERELEEE